MLRLRHASFALLTILWGSYSAPFAEAQLPQARLTSVFPLGAQRGTSVDINSLGGTDLDDATGLLFSHPGITAVPKMNAPGQFTVSVAADVPLGLYDVCVKGVFGVSNPRTFSVGERKEVLEAEPNNEFAKPQVVELNTVVNGRSDGGADVDFYRVSGKAGQRLLVEAAAQRVDSRMTPILELYNAAGRKLAFRPGTADDPLLDYSLPADGDYVVKVYDSVYGGSAEYGYRLVIHTGPHVDSISPSSGIPGTTAEYTLYGRNLPGGQPTDRKSFGRPLNMLKVQIALPADSTIEQASRPLDAAEAAADGFSYRLVTPEGSTNPVAIFFATAPTAVEAEPNDTPAQPQVVTLPIEISGAFQARGDSDLFQFDAKAGDIYWVDVFGERNGSAADPYMVIEQVKKDDKGVETVSRITALDDNPLNVGGPAFNSSSDDPVFKFAAPADGTFRITLRDRNFESRGDPTLTYRMAVRKETPDFRLVALPVTPTNDPNAQTATWDLGLRKGDTAQLNVLAYRQDGFNGVIDVTLEGLPEGVTCSGASIGAGQSAAVLVLSSTEAAADWAGTIRVVGKAKLEDAALVKAAAAAEAAAKAAVAEAAKAAADAKPAADQKVTETAAALAAAVAARDQAVKTLTHDARGGTVVWGGNVQAPIQSRVARMLTLAVLKEVAQYQLLTDVAKFEVSQSSQILIPLKLLKRAGFDNPVTLTYITPPPNVQVENKPIAKGQADLVYRIFVQPNAAPGTYTLFQQSQTQVSYKRHPEKEVAAVAEKTEAEKALAASTATMTAATAAKVAADKLVVDTAALAKKATDDQVAIAKVAAETDAAAKKAGEEKVVADKLVVDTEAVAKKAAEEKAVTDKASAEADAVVKATIEAAAKAKEAADKAPDDKALQEAKAAIDKAVISTTEAAKKPLEAKIANDKKAVDAAEVAKKAAEAKAVVDKKVADAQALAKKAAEDKVAADIAVIAKAAEAKKAVEGQAVAVKAMADADAALKAATAAKAAADKKATDAANVAKPQNLNAFSPAPSIVVTVKQGPGTLGVAPANGGAVKRGEKLEVKVTVARANGFAGPVTLSLPMPPGVVGLKAADVVIPADKNDGMFVIEAAADATMGQLPNMVVRGSMEFNGQAAVDQPIAINVQ